MAANVYGLEFPNVNYDDVLLLFDKWIVKRTSPFQVCVVNVHTLIYAIQNPVFYNIYKDAVLLTMDGQPLRWYANAICDANVQDTVNGPDLMRKCLHYGCQQGWKHFFLGGKKEVLESLTKKIRDQHPSCIVAGTCSPPFRELTDEEKRYIIQMINSSDADILWVGLGAPKQEEWIYEHLSATKIPIQIGVGAAFDFYAGSIERAPIHMRRLGLEWLYRAYKDPRLWKRYLYTNRVFLRIFLIDWLKQKINGKRV